MEHIELNAESRWFFITHHMNGSCRKFFKETLSLITSTVSLQGACSQNNAGMHALFKFNPRQRERRHGDWEGRGSANSLIKRSDLQNIYGAFKNGEFVKRHEAALSRP